MKPCEMENADKMLDVHGVWSNCLDKKTLVPICFFWFHLSRIYKPANSISFLYSKKFLGFNEGMSFQIKWYQRKKLYSVLFYLEKVKREDIIRKIKRQKLI